MSFSFASNLEVDGCPSKENLFGHKYYVYIVFP